VQGLEAMSTERRASEAPMDAGSVCADDLVVKAAVIMANVAEALREADCSSSLSIATRFLSANVVSIEAPATRASAASAASKLDQATTVCLWNPCDESVGVLRGIADSVGRRHVLSASPQEPFQACTIDNSVAAIVAAMDAPKGMHVDVAQAQVFTVGGVAEQMLTRLGTGAVVMKQPGPTPSILQQVEGDGRESDFRALMDSVAQAAKADLKAS